MSVAYLLFEMESHTIDKVDLKLSILLFSLQVLGFQEQVTYLANQFFHLCNSQNLSGFYINQESLLRKMHKHMQIKQYNVSVTVSLRGITVRSKLNHYSKTSTPGCFHESLLGQIFMNLLKLTYPIFMNLPINRKIMTYNYQGI